MSRAFAHLLSRYGYSAVIVFFIAEGVGIPFPAETMLVTAAAFAALHLWDRPADTLAYARRRLQRRECQVCREDRTGASVGF
ncbi:MAG TPA: hypothetical protein VII52_05115 [Gemmatimonadaceae bacterium]